LRVVPNVGRAEHRTIGLLGEDASLDEPHPERGITLVELVEEVLHQVGAGGHRKTIRGCAERGAWRDDDKPLLRRTVRIERHVDIVGDHARARL
jgi:hypothetical protein